MPKPSLARFPEHLAGMQEQLIETCLSGMMLMDLRQQDLPIVYVNTAFEQLTGYSAAEVIGRNAHFLQGDDRQQPAIEQMRSALERRQTIITTLRNYRKDGSLFWNEVRISYLQDPQGTVTHAVGVLNDVTARISTFEHYQPSFESTSAVHLLIDAVDGHIVDANPAAVRFYGYPADQLKSMFIYDINRLGKEEFLRITRQIRSERVIHFMAQHRLASGAVRDVEVFGSHFETAQGWVNHVVVVDVTERMIAEGRYQSLFKQSNDAVFILDLEGRHLQVNQRASDLLGYSTEELLRMSNRDSVAPTELNKSINVIERLKTGEQIAPYHRVFRRKDGSLVDTEINVELVRDSRGEPLHVISIVRDITERQRSAAALKESEERYRSVFENNLAIKLLIDYESGQIVDTNSAAVNFYGYSREKLLSMRIADINTLTPEQIQAEMKIAERYHSKVYHFKHRLADGTIRDVEVYSGPVEIQGRKFLHSIVHDETDRLRAEQALKVSEEKLRSFLEHSNDGVLMTDEEGRVIEWNSSAARLTSIPQESAIGQFIWDIQYQLAPENRKTPLVYERLKTLILGFLQTRHSAGLNRLEETVIYRPDGTQSVVQSGLFSIATSRGLRFGNLMRDITENKRIENALRQSEEKYRLLAENVKDAILRFSADAQRTYTSPAIYDLVGYTPEEMMEKPFLDLVHPDDSRFLTEMLQRTILSGGHKCTTIQRVQHRDGHYIWTEASNTIVRNPETGEVTGFIGIVHDITERKQVEDALRDSEVRLAQAQRIAHMGDWDYEMATGKLTWSDESYRLYGYRPHEVVPTLDLVSRRVHPDDADLVSWMWNNALEHDEDYIFDHRLLLPDGQVVWLHIEGETLRDDEGLAIRLFGTVQDITERRKMEAALRQSEEQYRLIAENTSDGILLLDSLTGVVTYASPAFDLQHGRTIGETQQLDPDGLREAIHPEDRPRILQQIFDAVDRKKADLVYVYRSQHKDGHYFWSEDHTHLNYAPDGKYLSSIIVSRDVTERKLAEEKQLALVLEKERTDLLTRFIRDAAHEFRTPLSVISSAAYLLLHSDKPEVRQRKADSIEAQIKRITRLLNSLLLMTRVDSHDVIEKSPVDLGLILLPECQQAQDRYGDHPIIQYSHLPHLPSLTGDANLLADAFRQIMDNAMRFTPKDGSVTVLTGTEGDQVWVEVADTGIGIAPEDLPRVFDTFWRHDEAHSTAGFGLGLSITKRIIERHGGTIMVRSQPGQGTQVHITLPVTA